MVPFDNQQIELYAKAGFTPTSYEFIPSAYSHYSKITREYLK
ncbi:hypothetical protein SAMN05421797_1011361 [Maribacter ulvicola]|uniref:Uncharacterized protein n=1 Tax=Maribacter ulvicola TaxID=228959 RepID=A0A1N6RPU3_9FLAO|nr:hypothetical protein SAMN05421797_1011361 [Maribacter ulvicola]